MSRTLTHVVDAPPSSIGPGRFASLARIPRLLLPLWRYAVWLSAFFVVAAIGLQIRLDVQQVRKDLDRTGYAHREATVVGDRLQLELDTRRRVVAVEGLANHLGMSADVELIGVAP